jgi:dihydroorotase
MSALLLKGGRVIDPANALDGVFDVLVSGSEIEAVDRGIVLKRGVELIDVSGCWVMPGLIDAHVHLRDPGFPQKETIASGLRAAAAGGFTTVAAMANTSPVNDCPEITRYMLREAERAHASRLVPVSALTKGLGGNELVDFPAMVEAGARLFSDDGIPIDDQAVLANAMTQLRGLGYAISLHEEDRALTADGVVNDGVVAKILGVRGIPTSAESSRIRRDLAIAIGSGASVHIAHVSTAESLELIRVARKRDANVTCEATPHHFTLDESTVLHFGPNAKMSPPLRSRADVQALRTALADGTVDMIATDHAPHDLASKQLDVLAGLFAGVPEKPEERAPLPSDAADAMAHAANGVVGLETAVGLAMRLVHESILSPTRLVELMALNPAKLLRLGSGTLAFGAVADITVIDPNVRWTVDPEKFHSKSRNTPFAGLELRGRAILTIVKGKIAYDGRRN